MDYDYELGLMKRQHLPSIEEARNHLTEGRFSVPDEQADVLRRGENVTQETHSVTPSPIMKKAFRLAEYINYSVRGNKI